MSVILCTAGYDHTIRFWEALSGLCSRQISHPDSQINRLCISPNKQYLAAAGKFSVKLFSCKANADQNPILVFEGHTGNITGVGFHCDTKWMVTSSEDGTVKIWDTKNGTVQRNYNHGSPVNDVVIHPNQGELISCDRGGNVRIWDLSENKCSHQLIPEENTSVASVTVASDGSLLCAGNNNGNVYVWRLLQHQDATSLVPVCKFAAHNTYITRVLLSPDVRHLATCSADHTARIWTVDLSYSPPSPAAEAPTSPTANGGDNLNSYPTTNNSTRLQHTHSQNPAAHNFRVGGGPPAPPPPHSTTNASFITSGPGIARRTPSSGANMNGQGREPNAFPLESTLMGHQRWVWDCAFSADSAYLVTACSDHYARLWDLKEQTVIRQYNGHHRGAVCVALNDYSEPEDDSEDSEEDS